MEKRERRRVVQENIDSSVRKEEIRINHWDDMRVGKEEIRINHWMT